MEINKLKETYGFNKSSYKYITPGAEILKLIGQNVVVVEFNRNEDGVWEDTYTHGHINSIDDFEALTMTYMCTYTVEGSEEEKQVRIIPEGFSFEDPEKTGTMIRFVPLSLHCKLMEDELFFLRLRELYDSRKTMDLDILQSISDVEDQGKILRYSRHIGAAIELEDGSLIWIRLQKLKLIHKKGTKYFMSFGDSNENISIVIDSQENSEFYTNRYGKIKIIDLGE